MSSGRSSSTPTVMNTHSGSVRTALLAPATTCTTTQVAESGMAAPSLRRSSTSCAEPATKQYSDALSQASRASRARFTARVEKVGGFARLHMQSAGLRIQRTPF